MAIQIGKYNFHGPFITANNLLDQSGVYTILGRSAEHENWSVLDVGESEAVRTRVAAHDRAECWKRRGHRTLAAAALYVPERQRITIEQELRAAYNPPCGVR